MTTSEIRAGYQSFFLKAEAGKHYVQKLTELIDTNHRKAENEPELSRDYMQRAKGLREALDMITSLTAGGNTGE